MSSAVKNILIRGISTVGGLYLCYELCRSIYYENKVAKLEALRQHRRRLGQSTDDIQADPKVVEYLDNHYGRKLQERMSTQYMIEEQIKQQIHEKQQLRELIVQQKGDQSVEQLDKEIERLNDLFTKIKPAKILPHPNAGMINTRDNHKE